MGHESTAGRPRRTLVTELQNWAARWGDLASIAGLVLSIVGFGVTILGVWRAKSAAEQARQAAVAARESIAHYDAIADLSAAIAIMDEIKRLQREHVWSLLPDRYSELRRRLVAIRESHAQLSRLERQTIRLAIGAFAECAAEVELRLEDGSMTLSAATLNGRLSYHLDEVYAVLLSLQRSLRSEP